MHAETELNAWHKHMLVVDVFDERAIPPSSAESREAERGSLRAFPCAEVGLTSASTHIVEHLVEGQPEVIAVFKVLPDVQIGPREMEAAGDFTGRLALLEELKTMPFAAVWDEYCRRSNVPVGTAWLDEVRSYERDILSQRA